MAAAHTRPVAAVVGQAGEPVEAAPEEVYAAARTERPVEELVVAVAEREPGSVARTAAVEGARAGPVELALESAVAMVNRENRSTPGCWPGSVGLEAVDPSQPG